MKKIVYSFIVGLLLISCNSKKYQNQLRLNGKVQFCSDTKYSAKEIEGEVIIGDILGRQDFLFNEKGSILKETHYNAYGEDIKMYEYIYNKENIVEKSTFHDKINDIKEGHNYIKRTWEREIREFYSTNDERNGFFYIIRGKKGWTIEIQNKNTGNIVSRKDFFLDKSGNIIEEIDKENEKIVYWFQAKFDKQNQEVERNIIQSDSLIGLYRYEYENFDDKNNWISKLEYKNGELTTRTIRTINYMKE